MYTYYVYIYIYIYIYIYLYNYYLKRPGRTAAKPTTLGYFLHELPLIFKLVINKIKIYEVILLYSYMHCILIN